MQVTLRSTDKVVMLVTDAGAIQARIWEGTTSGGIRCHAYITRIAVNQGEDAREFESDLKEQDPPTAEIRAIPMRLII